MGGRGVRDVLITTVAYGTLSLTSLTSLASGILAARLLGPDGRGELAAVFLWAPLIATMGGFAISDAIVYAGARKSEAAHRIFASAIALGAGLSVVLMVIGYFLFPLLYADCRPEVRAVATLYLVFIPLTTLTLYAQALFQGGLRLGTWNFIRVFVAVSYVAFIGLVALAGMATVRGFAVASVLANAATLTLALVLIARLGWVSLRPSFAVMKGFVRYGLPIHLGVIALIINDKLAQILISQWQDTRSFGFYVISLGAIATVYGFVGLLGALVFPKVANQATDEGKAEVFGRYFRLIVALSLPSTAALIVLAPWLLTLLYGAAFEPAAPVLMVLALGAPGYAAKIMFIQAFKAYGRTTVISRTELFALVVNAIALVVLLRYFGIIGAAWAFVIAQGAAAIFIGTAARRSLGMTLVELVRPRMDDWHRLIAGLREWRAGAVGTGPGSSRDDGGARSRADLSPRQPGRHNRQPAVPSSRRPRLRGGRAPNSHELPRERQGRADQVHPRRERSRPWLPALSDRLAAPGAADRVGARDSRLASAGSRLSDRSPQPKHHPARCRLFPSVRNPAHRRRAAYA